MPRRFARILREWSRRIGIGRLSAPAASRHRLVGLSGFVCAFGMASAATAATTRKEESQ